MILQLGELAKEYGGILHVSGDDPQVLYQLNLVYLVFST